MNCLVEYLNEVYQNRKKRNEKYSLRSFSRDLRISSGRLVSILNNKDIPGKITLRKIFEALETPEDIKAKIMKDMPRARVKHKNHKFAKVLSPTEVEQMAHWEAWAIYTLMQREDYDLSVNWLAKKLEMTDEGVLSYLRPLVQIGLVQKSGNEYKLQINNVTSSEEIPSKVIRELHKQFMKRASLCLDEVPVDSRDVTGITFCVEQEKLQMAKLIISDFRSKMVKLVGTTTPSSELYQLSVQFFPLIFKKGS